MPYGPEMCVEGEDGAVHLGGATTDELQALGLTLPKEPGMDWILRTPEDAIMGGAFITKLDTIPTLTGGLASEARHRGFGKSAVRAVVCAAFHPVHGGLDRLSATVPRTDMGALKVLASNGFIWMPDRSMPDEYRLEILNPAAESWQRTVDEWLESGISKSSADKLRQKTRRLMQDAKVHFCAEISCPRSRSQVV